MNMTDTGLSAVSRRRTTDLTVAVVIPCHDYGHFLSDAIESVRGQSRPADTVLVVDDGSTDDTRSVVERYAGEVGYLRIDVGSPSAARNAGARAVDTDLVVFLDADDRIETSFLERCIGAMPEDWTQHFVYTDFRRFGGSDALHAAPAYDLAELARENYIGPTTLLPRAEVARIGYDESLRIGLEDWDLYLTLAEQGIEGVLVGEPLFLYRIHGDGITWRLRRKPLLLAALRLRLVMKHRCLYTSSSAARRVKRVFVMLCADTEERYQLARRTQRFGRLAKDLVRRG
jgi:glycosyltransferase involved in cell wall biosynthesis